MDFIHDTLADGRSFRTLNLTDTFTRQCLGQEVDSSLSGHRVTRLLDHVVERHGLPAEIQMDNGPEFRSKALDLWAYGNGVKLVFIDPGKPTAPWADRTVTSKVSTDAFAPSVWIKNGLGHWHRRDKLSRHGGLATIAKGRTRASAMCRLMSGRKGTIGNRKIPCSDWYTFRGRLRIYKAHGLRVYRT